MSNPDYTAKIEMPYGEGHNVYEFYHACTALAAWNDCVKYGELPLGSTFYIRNEKGEYQPFLWRK